MDESLSHNNANEMSNVQEEEVKFDYEEGVPGMDAPVVGDGDSDADEYGEQSGGKGSDGDDDYDDGQSDAEDGEELDAEVSDEDDEDMDAEYEDDEEEDDEYEGEGDEGDEEGGGDDDDEGASSRKKRGGAKATKAKKAAKSADGEAEPIQYGIDSDDEGDVEFEKFEEGTRDQYLLNFHPEALPVNFEEVKSMCTVVRDEDGDIVDPFHTTIPILTKYEKARILGMRAKQLNSNIRPTFDVPDFIVDSYRIAEMELERKIIPFIIKRPLPDGRSEYWRIEDLTCVY